MSLNRKVSVYNNKIPKDFLVENTHVVAHKTPRPLEFLDPENVQILG